MPSYSSRLAHLFDEVRISGKRVDRGNLTLKLCFAPNSKSALVFSTPKKAGNAIWRNTLRRIAREHFKSKMAHCSIPVWAVLSIKSKPYKISKRNFKADLDDMLLGGIKILESTRDDRENGT